MAVMRQYQTLYGIYTDDWTSNIPNYSNWHYHLVKDYIDNDCDRTDNSEASITRRFFYPHTFAETYNIEGIIEGHIKYTSTATSTCTDVRVSLIKVHEDTTETEIASTGTKTVNKSIVTNDLWGFWFTIDVTSAPKITKEEKLGLKIETTCASTIKLSHTNDSSTEDIKIKIPYM